MAKVLIVDDSSFLRMTIKKLLEKNYEFDILEASNGKQALDLYKKKEPDLVILDILMPEERGIETLPQIMEYNPKAKVIMCTSVGNQQMVVRAVQAGAKGFIVKPISKEDLYKQIDKVLVGDY